MKQKIHLLALALAASIVAACVAPAAPAPAPAAPAQQKPAEEAKPTEAPKEEAQPTEAPAAAGEKVKINWWHINTGDPGKKAFQDLADQYMKDHPNVQIDITVIENQAFKQKLATAMQSGSPPDIFQSWGGGVLGQYAAAGLVQDLDEAIKQDGWGDSFQPGPLSLYNVNGKQYGVPWTAGMVGFWYNKELFNKAGIDQPPQTWDELLTDVKKLKDAGITPIALGGKEKWPGHFWWVYLAVRLGGKEAFEKAYNRQGTFADEPFVEAGNKLKQLIDLQPFQDGFLGASYGDHISLMANGQAAMELMGQWAPGADRGSAKDVDTFNKNLGWFPFPTVEGQKGDNSDVLGGGDGFAIGKNAPKEAIDFVRFMTSLDSQKMLTKQGVAAPPVVKGAESELSDPLLQEVMKHAAAAKYFQLYYDQFLPPAVGEAVNDKTQELFAGTASPEDVAKGIEEVAAAEMSQ